MFTLIVNVFKKFFWNEEYARTWMETSFRAFLLWGAALLTQVMVDPTYGAWTGKEWAKHLGVAAIAGLGGLVKAGDKNPPPPAPAEQPKQ